MSKFKRFLFSLSFLFVPLFVVAQSFPLPSVPKELKGVEVRANYLALHYWDRYDFADNALIGDKDISEQGFSNFISIMPYVTEKDAAFAQLAGSMIRNPRMVDYFVALGMKYLYEPASPVYDDGLYILLLENILKQQSLSDRQRQELQFDLKMANKNRVGGLATDFGFLARTGERNTLLNVKGEYILLFFGDPDCDYCTEAKGQLLSMPAFGRLVADGDLKVILVSVEGMSDAWKESRAPEGWIDACDDGMEIHNGLLYEIPGLPVLYLLDKSHRVLLKNTSPAAVENFFMNILLLR